MVQIKQKDIYGVETLFQVELESFCSTVMDLGFRG